MPKVVGSTSVFHGFFLIRFSFCVAGRSVLSNVYGYLGNISLPIMVARICQLYPKALPATIVSRFFMLYCRWYVHCFHLCLTLSIFQELATASAAESD